MDPERHRLISRLLNEALEREPGERRAFLGETCGDDRDLWRRVLALLDAHEGTTGFDAGSSPGAAVRAAWEAREAVAAAGERVGPYVLEEEIGSGGMGVVWRARDERLGRPVAVKMLRRAQGASAALDERLMREARLGARLSHPHVAIVHDLPEQDDRLAIVMELLEGESLAARLRRGPLALGEALRLGVQVASALEAAHERGVVHRDLKPGNVHVLPGGDAKVLDFGIAGLAVAVGGDGSEDDEGLTSVAGTPGYMSPEQLRGLELDGRSDLFSLGVVLFECLIGAPAFPGGRPTERNRRALRGDADWRRLPAGAPRSLVELLERCLAVEPAERPRSAGQLREALESLAAELGAAAVAPTEADAFVGREAELARLADLLASDDRFVAVTGEAGMGKSRLVDRLLRDHAGPVLRCELGDAGSLDEALGLLAAAAGAACPGEQPIQDLADALAARGELLLVLDDWNESLPAVERLAATLLARARKLRVLVSTRAEVVGGAVLRLEGLPLQPDAVELFVVRARQHLPGFADGDRAALERIAERLAGRPLAIELAAARLRSLELDELHPSLAAGRSGGALSLDEVLDWAWDQLDPWERSALTQVSVFRGGFALESAEEVLELGDHEDAPWGPEAMELLAAKDRLRESSAPGRLQVPRCLREHAARRGDAGPAARRHAEHFSALGQEPELRSRDGEQGRERRALYRTESQNLRAALRRCLDREHALTAARLLRACEAVASGLGGSAELELLARRLVGLAGEEAEATLAAGRVFARRAATDEARRCFERALGALTGGGRERLRLRAGMALAELESQDPGAESRARRLAEEALELATALGADRRRGRLLALLATLDARAGRDEAAEIRWRESIAELREAGDLQGLAASLQGLGASLREAGREEEAAPPLAEAQSLRLRLGPD